MQSYQYNLIIQQKLSSLNDIMGKKVNRHPNFLIKAPNGRPTPYVGRRAHSLHHVSDCPS